MTTEQETGVVHVPEGEMLPDAGQLSARALARRTTLSDGIACAKDLVSIIDHTQAAGNPMVTVIKGKRHLRVEGWQFICEWHGMTLTVEGDPEWIEPEGDWPGGYRAYAVILDQGAIVSRAMGLCGLDAFVCDGKDGGDKHQAAQSMAQTRALSKVCRNKYGFIVSLGGMETVPAEDEEPGEAPAPKRKNTGARGRKPSKPANGGAVLTRDEILQELKARNLKNLADLDAFMPDGFKSQDFKTKGSKANQQGLERAMFVKALADYDDAQAAVEEARKQDEAEAPQEPLEGEVVDPPEKPASEKTHEELEKELFG